MTTTSYGSWINHTRSQYLTLRQDVEESLGEFVDEFDVDAIEDEYRAAINAALPEGVTLAGDEFYGPVLEAISPVLPDGFRWATAVEAEHAFRTGFFGMVQVRVGGTDDEPWTDLAMRVDGEDPIAVAIESVDFDAIVQKHAFPEPESVAEVLARLDQAERPLRVTALGSQLVQEAQDLGLVSVQVGPDGVEWAYSRE